MYGILRPFRRAAPASRAALLRALEEYRGLPREIWALAFVRFVVSAGSFVLPFLAMMLTIRLGYDYARAGVFMAASTVVAAGGMLLGGKLGDSIGRRATLLLLLPLSAAGFLACAILGYRPVMPYVATLAVGALGGTWPCLTAVVADLVPPARLKGAFSLLYWANNLGFAIGPFAGGYLFTAAPRGLFVGNAAALVLAALAILLRVPEAGHPAGGGGRETAGTLRVLRAQPVLVWFGLLEVVTTFVYCQYSFALPYFLKDLLGDVGGPKAFGAVMAINGLTVVVFTLPLTAATRRLSSLGGMAASSLVFAVGFGTYVFARSLPFVLVVTAFWTLGEILGATSGNAFVAERSDPGYRARLSAVVATCQVVGQALAPLAAGFVTLAYGTRAVWLPVGAVSLLAAFGFESLRRWDEGRRARR